MNKNKEDIIRHLGTTILFVLCFILLSVFSRNSTKQDNTVTLQYQIGSVHILAVSSKNILILSSLQNFLSLVDEKNFRLPNEHLKILIFNKLINQRIVFLRKVELLIKPVAFHGLYYYLSLYSEDLPVLS
jgi:hypothetical protein